MYWYDNDDNIFIEIRLFWFIVIGVFVCIECIEIVEWDNVVDKEVRECDVGGWVYEGDLAGCLGGIVIDS